MNDVSVRVKEVIAEKLGVDISKVTDSARIIDDLGADSLDTVELVMQLEEEFDLEIPDSVTAELVSVKKVVDYVNEKMNGTA
jgi:acyl carrier protein